MELLSPAGNLECGMAAFEYGADAVYLGLHQFSARADAENFDWEDLSILLGIAHRASKKVYVAMNTILRDSEIPLLIETLARLENMQIDALIIQDLAVWQIVHHYFPEMILHASTQMAIHNHAGVEQAKAMGFKRVIVARELTLAELKDLSSIPDIEIEAFCHGALCYAYSGLCQLSSYLRGTSGNRGNCSYICRNNFAITDDLGKTLSEDCAVMSMKDLACGDLIHSFKETGVTSLKIEGRKKTPLYVAAVTNYYRHLLDNTFTAEQKEERERDIQTIFSRSWTTYCLRGTHAPGITDTKTLGPRGAEMSEVLAVIYDNDLDFVRFQIKNHTLEKHDGLQIELADGCHLYGFGVDELRVFQQGNNEDYQIRFTAEPGRTVEVPLPEGHPDIAVGKKIYCNSSQEVKRSYHWESVRPALDRNRFPIYFDVIISENKLEVHSQPNIGTRELDDVITVMPLEKPLTPARKPEGVTPAIKQAFEKLGDSSFTLGDIKIQNPKSLFAPTSYLNKLRRQAIDDVDAAIKEDFSHRVEKITKEVTLWQPPEKTSEGSKCILKIDHCYYLNVFSAQELEDIDEIIFAIDCTPPAELPDALKILELKLRSRTKIRLAVSPIMRDNDGMDWPKLISQLYRSGWKKWQISNLAQLQLLADLDDGKLDMTADAAMYAQNSTAAQALIQLHCQRVTLSPDDTIENTCALLQRLGSTAEVILYEDIPLAYSATCANASMLGYCPGKKDCTFTKLHLTSRKNEKLIAQNHNCETIYYAEAPMNKTHLLNAFHTAGGRLFRLDFIWREYTPVQIHEIWSELNQHLQKL